MADEPSLEEIFPWMKDQPASPAGSGLPAYPDEADAKIRKVADFFGRGDVLGLLNQIRVELLGDYSKVQRVAAEFSGCVALSHARDDIDSALQSLAGTWEGRAYEQFKTYAGRVTGALQGNQDVVKELSKAVTSTAATIAKTYGDAIKFIGQCAGALAGLGWKVAVAIGTIEIPGVDIITSGAVLNAIGDAFSAFVQNAGALLAAAVDTVSQYVTQAISVIQAGANYREIPELVGGSGVNDSRQWKVDPSAYPDS